MVKIKLDDTYWLHSDEKQWKIGVFEVQNTAKGLYMFKPKAYLTTLSVALSTYYDMALKESRATSWEQLVKDGKEIRDRIDKILAKIEKIRIEVK